MARLSKETDRDELLADVADMYYDQGLTQADISSAIGITRSAISRMLTEARNRGIVEIRVHHPLRFDARLQHALIERFGLADATILDWKNERNYDALRERLGLAAAQELKKLIRPGCVIGVAWGTTVSATIDALEDVGQVAAQVIQLVGVLGSTDHAYNAQALVERATRKVGGKPVYLYTPFIVDSPATARSLMRSPQVKHAIHAAQNCEIAVLGIGSTEPDFCSLYQGGHITREDLQTLLDAGAVGDVSGYYFRIDGQAAHTSFHDRLIGIPYETLAAIPLRLGVAGGGAKVSAILGALQGGRINFLVTDSLTAQQVLGEVPES